MEAKITLETEVIDESGPYVKKRLTGKGEVYIKYDEANDESFITELFELLGKYGKKYFSGRPGPELMIPKRE